MRAVDALTDDQDHGLTRWTSQPPSGREVARRSPCPATRAEYSSLNLAQACLVHAYEIFLAVGDFQQELPRGRRSTRPPTQQELEQTYQALQGGLARIEFFKARKPAAVMRTLRTIIARAKPDLRESRLLAAIGFEIGHYIDRLVERLRGGGADEPPPPPPESGTSQQD